MVSVIGLLGKSQIHSPFYLAKLFHPTLTSANFNGAQEIACAFDPSYVECASCFATQRKTFEKSAKITFLHGSSFQRYTEENECVKE